MTLKKSPKKLANSKDEDVVIIVEEAFEEHFDVVLCEPDEIVYDTKAVEKYKVTNLSQKAKHNQLKVQKVNCAFDPKTQYKKLQESGLFQPIRMMSKEVENLLECAKTGVSPPTAKKGIFRPPPPNSTKPQGGKRKLEAPPGVDRTGKRTTKLLSVPDIAELDSDESPRKKQKSLVKKEETLKEPSKKKSDEDDLPLTVSLSLVRKELKGKCTSARMMELCEFTTRVLKHCDQGSMTRKKVWHIVQKAFEVSEAEEAKVKGFVKSICRLYNAIEE